MSGLVKAVLLVLLTYSVISSAAPAQAPRAPLYSQWMVTDLGEFPGWFNFQDWLRQASLTGLVGARVVRPPGHTPSFNDVAILYDVNLQEWWAVEENDGGIVREITPNGLAIANLDGGRAPVLYDHRTDETTQIPLGFGHGRIVEAMAVNNLGQVAVIDYHADNERDVHIWPTGEVIEFPEDASDVSVTAISETGWVVGEVFRNLGEPSDPTVGHPFRWHTDTGLQILDPNLLGRNFGEFTAVNNNGVAVGRVFNDSGNLNEQWILWGGNSIIQGSFRGTLDINDQGGVVGSGALWNGTKIVQLPTLSGRPDLEVPMAMHLLNDWTVVGVTRQPNDVIDHDAEFNHHFHLVRWDPMVIAGDYDNSGMVAQGDLDLVLTNWGRDGVPEGWWHDLPVGPVDQAELDKVLLRWGRTDGTPVLPVGEAAVPEPAAVVLALIAAVGAYRARRVTPIP